MYIIGLLTQSQLTGLKVGDKLNVSRVAGDTAKSLAAQVESIEPEVMDLLDPFNPSPRYPTRGRRVRLRLVEADNTLVPGETVALQSARQRTWLDNVRRTCFFRVQARAALGGTGTVRNHE